MAVKNIYKEYYFYPDPLSESVVNRTTRYRRKRERDLEQEDLRLDDLGGCERGSESSNNVLSRDGMFSSNDNIDIVCDRQQLTGAYSIQASPCSSSLVNSVEELVEVYLEEDLSTETDHLLGEYFTDEYTEEMTDHSIPADHEVNDYGVDNEKEQGNDDIPHGSQESLATSTGIEVERTTVNSTDDLLFDGCPLSVLASAVLIKKYQMRHNISQEALADLLQLLKLHFPSQNNLPGTVHLFNKQLPVLSDPLYFTYFCNRCFHTIADKDNASACESCNNSLLEQGNVSSFIEVPLESQLITILQRKGIFEIIMKSSRVKEYGVYTDIKDGYVYQQFVADGFLSNPENISFQLNTDGVPVFKSSGCSFWPLLLVINELPPNLRIVKENQLIAGIWYGCCKPDMSLFLKPLAETLKLLYNKGVSISLPDGRNFTCHAALVCITCDMPAKAQVLNIIQYNGFYSCSYCKQRGETVKTGVKGRVQTYPFIMDDPIGPGRSNEEFQEFARKALLDGTPMFGVKGPSWLSIVPKFNMVKSIAMDYMHCVLLVVVRLLLRLWFSSSYYKELWYIGSHVSEVDVRLCSIRPSCEAQRTPRQIENTVKYWKAHELQMWLLHYSPVVLYGILPDLYYQHHLLLVEGSYLLLKDVVSNEDIEKSFKLFRHYCYLFSSYYGNRYMTVCLHSLMHLPECVRNLGPLWSHSCFTFENANGELLKLFHGTKKIEKQIVNHLSELQKLPTCAKSALISDSVEMDFYNKMCWTTNKNKNIIKFTEFIGVCGKPCYVDLDDSEKDLLSALDITVNGPVLSYPQLHFSKSQRTASRDSGKTLRDNSCIMYKTNPTDLLHVGTLQKVIIYSDECFLFVNTLEISEEKLNKDNITYLNIDDHIFRICSTRCSSISVIKAEHAIDKCLMMDVGNSMNCGFVSIFPNCKPLT